MARLWPSPHAVLKCGILVSAHDYETKVTPMVDENALSAMARLRIALRTLEADLGMGDLSPQELDALAAIVELSQAHQHFKPTELVNHRLLQQISRASKYRVIHSLEERGVLKPVDLKGRKFYTLNSAEL